MDSFEHYKRWKWGQEPDKVVSLNLPRVGAMSARNEKNPRFVEIGRLVGFYLRPDIDLSKNKKQKHTQELMLTQPDDIEKSHVVFDRKHKNHRIYISLAPHLMKDTKALYQSLDTSPVLLKDVVRTQNPMHTKGRHDASKDYPNVRVKPIGYVTDLIYKTRKSGDGLSEYIHAFGEPYGAYKKWTSRPILAVDKEGHLWFAGGNYRCPYAGITN